MSSTGIVMDPMFTVKSYLGMVGEMSKNPSVFKGRRVLYIHTGEQVLYRHWLESNIVFSYVLHVCTDLNVKALN